MYCPSLQEFLRLSKKGNLIPVYKEINADLDTPVSAFLKIQQGNYAFLLESVEGQEKIARYSFLGSNPSMVFISRGTKINILSGPKYKSRSFITSTDPIDEIKKIMFSFKPVHIKGLPRFYGGMVGYIGYDMVRFFENIPDKNRDTLGLPDSLFMLTDTILVFDRLNHVIKIVSNIIIPHKKTKVSETAKKRLYYAAISKIDNIEKQFAKAAIGKQKHAKQAQQEVSSNFTKPQFQRMVAKAKKYIVDGDIVQVVLSQRFKVKLDKGLFDIYRNLRSLNPSPYMFFLKLNKFSILGSSPEMLVRYEDGVAQTCPIAGTRPRGRDQKEDRMLERELLNDAKEKAEHLMLVDLGRNDLGRICKAGKVKVTNFMKVEKYSHVMHMVSEVQGQVDKKYTCFDCLRACFPAGTVSGSPKIRAMEIIDELENLRRGPYAGCVGYFSFSQNMDTCITIRTIVAKDKIAYIQAGGGIVADSVPRKEYMETVNKAKALIEAIKR